MRCHNLPHQITLQTRGSTVDGHGQTVESWADTRTCRAKCEPLTGREWFAAGQLQGSISLRVTIRYFAGITSGMRVVWRGDPYEIISVIEPDAGLEWLELMCASGVRDAR